MALENPAAARRPERRDGKQSVSRSDKIHSGKSGKRSSKAAADFPPMCKQPRTGFRLFQFTIQSAKQEIRPGRPAGKSYPSALRRLQAPGYRNRKRYTRRPQGSGVACLRAFKVEYAVSVFRSASSGGASAAPVSARRGQENFSYGTKNRDSAVPLQAWHDAAWLLPGVFRSGR